MALPYHRLNTLFTRLWNGSRHVQHTIATHLARSYGGPVVILNCLLEHIANVDERGNVKSLQPPFRQYEMWQVSNAPKPQTECACGMYMDLENGGLPWRDRGVDEHHPFCQFDRTAKQVFAKAANTAARRSEAGERPQARPDEWTRLRKES